MDDEYDITGSASGTNRIGKNYAILIDNDNPLHVKVGCRWIVSGKVNITPEGKPGRLVDYGTGACDNDATVTINSRTFNIKLR
jgi:hypothetical protein